MSNKKHLLIKLELIFNLPKNAYLVILEMK